MRFRLHLLCAAGLAVVGGVRAGEVTAPGVLEKRCLACHGAARMSDLDLRQRDTMLRGGKRGPAVVPGKPADSLLFQMVSGKSETRMPPGKDPLPPEEVAALRTWIAAGAEWPAGAKQATEPSWWSFRRLRRPGVPMEKEVRNPLDAFIARTLRQQALTPAPAAGRRTLIRRAYFDLIGLPPPPERVERFVQDESPDRWARLVDELLASPQYGERWGRHWLDVVRYADSGGYETDIYFKNAWRYRDYVIKSFNEDKPYDQFVKEQIAGDEFWPDDLDLGGNYTIAKEKLRHLEARIGTGLYTLGPEVHESNMDAPKLLYEKLTDWVDTTSSAFLGLTVGCARCHDHKFDPVSQRDYYRLAAVFAYSTEVEIPISHRMAIRDHGQHYPRVVAVAEARTAYRLHEEKIRRRLTSDRRKKFPPESIAAYDKKEDQRTPGEQKLAAPVAEAIRTIKPDQEMTAEEAGQSKALLEAIGKAVLAVPGQDAQGVPWDGLFEVPSASVLGHREPELVPDTFTLSRGELTLRKEKVPAGLPSFLGGGDLAADDCVGRCIPLARKQLALWLTQQDHPLTARVMVNRIWQGHFSRGIVATPNDFGRQGQAPVFPEMLDWLAAEFVSQGWSVKAMHRLIMTSDAYQRTSVFRHEANLRKDPDNRYLWRMNRRRLESEALWDAMLSAAGTLTLRMGGKPAAPPLAEDELSGISTAWQWPVSGDPEEHHRRGVYLLVRRNFPYPMFEAFDGPGNAVSCPQRDVSSVAPQALWFLNNRAAFNQAQRFAGRLRREAAATPQAWIDLAWRLALGRSPTARESTDAEALIAKLSLEKFCLSVYNLNEFSFVD
ncbi:MAG: PSD1 and planctomycete cytochrome C domain-containing protein [Bryobacteraceae bacterium]